jgi:phosphate:Na+ symporter
MVKDMIFGTVGGLGLFLFGMGLMSDGLKKVAGQKLRTL